MESDFLQLEAKVIEALKTIYDPEIPVNIYDLGLIYNIETDESGNVKIDMTLTAPNCPMAESLVMDVRSRLMEIEQVKAVDVNLVFEPVWTQDRLSDEAKLELGLL